MRSAQRRVLTALVNAGRIARMTAHAEGEEDAYTPSELLKDLRDGVFEEFASNRPNVDIYRRGLQRAYVTHLANVMSPTTAAPNPNIPPQFRQTGPSDSDLPALARAELKAIGALLERRRNGAGDGIVAAHIDDLLARIEDALDDDD